MARLLSIEEYGILAAIFSIVYILSIFSESIQTVVARYTSNEKRNGKIKNILNRALKKSWTFGVLVLIVYLIVSIALAFLLKIKYSILALNGLMILSAFMLPVTRGVLQGRAMFSKLGANMILEALLKLAFGIALVIIGFGIYGAIGASVIGGLVAFGFSFYSLKKIVKVGEQKAEIMEYKGFASPILYSIIVIFVFLSMDVFIARVVFDSSIAGIYSIASILSKTIFFGVQPISKAMFPIVSGNKKPRKLLSNSLIFTGGMLIIGLVILYFFPNTLINLFSGKNVPEASSILFLLGVAFSLLSLTNLIVLYKLARQKIKNYIYLGIVIPMQVILLVIFSSSLLHFALALIGASAIFLISSLLLLRD
jgi:O-antigen/teichoic acid export membrane protein